jgi:hypothetical protein
MKPRDLIRQAKRDGWTVTTTNGGHLRLEHPEASMPIFTGSTPSCPRAFRNALAAMKRALPREPKAPPVVERKRLPNKRRSPRKPTNRSEVDSAIDLYAPARPPRPQPSLPGAPRLRTTRWPT